MLLQPTNGAHLLSTARLLSSCKCVAAPRSSSRALCRQRAVAVIATERQLIMLRSILVTAIVAFALADTQAHRRQDAQGATPAVVTYDDFMKISVDQRRGRFGGLSAENKSLVLRTHAQRWLGNNRARLTASEVGVFQEMINFITPERYAKRAETPMDNEEQSLRAKMRCRVSSEDVVEAFNVFGALSQTETAKPTWTYLSQAKCWLEWIAEALVDIPTMRR
jgi:hypothetical protein